MNFLLATCTFLWVISNPSSLTQGVRETVEDIDNDVYVSAASMWEIAMKQALGRLRLPTPLDRYLVEQRERHRIKPLPIQEAAAFQWGKLPPLHKDPFDRMLVCQALVHQMVILTPDALISAYPVQTRW